MWIGWECCISPGMSSPIPPVISHTNSPPKQTQQPRPSDPNQKSCPLQTRTHGERFYQDRSKSHHARVGQGSSDAAAEKDGDAGDQRGQVFLQGEGFGDFAGVEGGGA